MLRRQPVDTKNKATYFLVIDYLAQMERADLISSTELATAKQLAAIQYGIKDVWQ